MSNELTIYDRIIDPLAYVKAIGHIIAHSKLYGCESEVQAEGLALLHMTSRMSLHEIRRRYHLTPKGLLMRADYQLGKFHHLGGEYLPWLKDGEDGIEARALWRYHGTEQEIGYTIKEARDEGLVRKDSRWQKNPASMLRARCASKAIKMVAPEITAGFYTETDMGLSLASDVDEDADEIDGELVVDGDPAPDEQPPDAPAVEAVVQPVNGACTSAQSTRIKELWGILDATPEQRDKMLAKRKAAAVRNLTGEQAGDLIATLEGLAAANQSAESPAMPETSDQLVARIKARLTELNQVHPGISDKFVAKLKASGRAKIADLPREHAMDLMSAMTGTDMESYLGVAIWPAPEPVKATDSKN